MSIRLLAALLLITSAVPLLADEGGWELKRDRDGIAIYTRAVEGSSYRAVRATMRIASTASAAVALILDTDACSEWADLCRESRVFEQVSDTEMYVYTLNDVPWPVSDRDATTHVLWQQDPESGAVTMTATIVSDKLPETPEAVRLAEGTTSWTFQPLPGGQLDVVSHAHIEPGGAIPGWLSNRLLVNSPFTTMAGMRAMLLSGRYDDVDIAFLSDIVPAGAAGVDLVQDTAHE